MNNVTVEANDITFNYKKNASVVKGVSLKLCRGEVLGLLGPNGAGKTTLIKLLLGLYAPSSGTVTTLGKDPYKYWGVRRKIGVMNQTPGFDQMISGWDNLYIAARFFGIKTDQVKRKVMLLSEMLGDPAFLKRPPITYSGGQRKRLQIVRALLNDPQLLILDEPTAALDIEGRQGFYEVLNNLIIQKGLTVIWTTHYLDEIEKNCSRVIIFKHGEVLTDSDISLLSAETIPDQIEIHVRADDTEKMQAYTDLTALICKQSKGCWVYKGLGAEFYTEILPDLLASGIPPEELAVQKPSLEDIYLSSVSNTRPKDTERSLVLWAV